MSLLDELFDTSMNALRPDINLQQKAQFKEVIEKIFMDGKSPHEALGFGPEIIEHFYSYGRRLYTSGNYQKSLDVFGALSLLKPEDYRFIFAQGAAYQKLKNYPEAVFAYIASANRNNQTPEPMFYLYDCFMQLELPQQALESLIEAIKRCGDKKEHIPLKARCAMIIQNLRQQVLGEEKHKNSESTPAKSKIQEAA